MKRILSTAFITLLLLAGAVGAAPTAHADEHIPAGQEVFGSDYDQGYEVQEAANSSYTPAATAPDKASASTPLGLQKDPIGEGFGGVMIWIMSLFAWLVGVAAVTLDYAVYYTVVTMGNYVKDLSAVGVTWRIMRDIGNIFLIFGFLAVGVTTILNVDWYGGGKKMLPMMFVAAVFLNFSLFIAMAFIDTGNLFATQFYTQIKGGSLTTDAYRSKTSFMTQVEEDGISNKIMGQLGLQTIYGEISNSAKAKEILKAGNSWVIGFMGVILFLITAFVMFSLAFILIARFVALLLLIIVSPIGFAGLAVPGMKARAEQWWTTLFEQTITAPILLLMLYVALAVITDAQFLTGFCLPGDTATFGGVNTNSSCTASAIGWTTGNFNGFASFILSFLVAIGLLISVVIYSKRWSAFGGDMATKLAGRLTFGVAGQLGRTAIGWPAQYASKKFRSSPLSRAPIVGRAIANVLDRGAQGSFDVRGTGVFSKIPFGPVEAGESQKGGYRENLAKAVKGREEHAKTLHLSGREEAQVTVAEAAAEVAHDVYEASPKQAADRLALKLAQKAVSDKKGAAQLGYAAGLDVKPWGWLSRNSEAAKNIRKTVEKSKDQQQIDALMNTIRNAAPAAGAPAGAPAAGGGVHP